MWGVVVRSLCDLFIHNVCDLFIHGTAWGGHGTSIKAPGSAICLQKMKNKGAITHSQGWPGLFIHTVYDHSVAELTNPLQKSPRVGQSRIHAPYMTSIYMVHDRIYGDFPGLVLAKP